MATLNLSLYPSSVLLNWTPPTAPIPPVCLSEIPPGLGQTPLRLPYCTSIEEQAETPMPCFGGESYRCHQFTLFIICIPSLYSAHLCCNSLILIFVLNKTAFHARRAILYDINNHITIIMDSYSLSMLICLLVVIYLLLFHEDRLRVFVDMCKWGLQMKTMNEIKKKSVLY